VRLSTIEDIVRVVCEGSDEEIVNSVTERIVSDLHMRINRESKG
jgi:phosphomannomutase